MRNARPVDALSSQSGVACQASAALGETKLFLRGAKSSSFAALPSWPPYASQRSWRRPRVVFQSLAKRHVSCT
ncbi:hypothetical protein D9M70_643130 [compost metagenome]